MVAAANRRRWMRAWVGRVAALTLAGLCALAARAAAEPANGFGAELGVIANYYSQTKPFASAGGSIGGDMQFAVNETWSLNPYLMLSGETLFDGKSGSAVNGAAGFEVRRWAGDTFFGAHLGAYTALIVQKGSSQNLYQPGVGVTLGVERPSGIGYALVVDLPRSLKPIAGWPVVQADVVQSEVRLHLTYRFR